MQTLQLLSGHRPNHRYSAKSGIKPIYHNMTKLALLFALLTSSLTVNGCSDPEAAAAQYAAQAEILFDQNRIAEARQTIGKAIAERDDVAEYHILRGRIEFKAGAFENAYSAYNEALSLNPSSQEALQAVSQLGLRVGRFNESVDATEKLLVLLPNQTDALLIRGLHALIKRNYDAATKTADEILNIDQTNEGGVVLKARASFLSGDSVEAARILENFESSRPNTQAVALTRLEIYRSLRNPQMMAKQYADLEKMRPDDLVLMLDHADFLFKTGRTAEATKLVSSVMATKAATPQNIESVIRAWQEYSVATIDVGQIRAIVTSATSAARIAAARYFADRDDNVATALLAGMTGPDADAERAKIALNKGDKARAQFLVQEILNDDKTHCSALKTQAMLAAADRRSEDALSSAQRASSECPNRPDLWQLTAKIYATLGDQANATRVFGQGIEENKQSEPLTRAYSTYLLSLNRGREAIATTRKLTRAAPALISGWQLYLETCTKTRSACVNEAKEGLADSRTRFGVDLLPGELPPNGLFGRLANR